MYVINWKHQSNFEVSFLIKLRNFLCAFEAISPFLLSLRYRFSITLRRVINVEWFLVRFLFKCRAHQSGSLCLRKEDIEVSFIRNSIFNACIRSFAALWMPVYVYQCVDVGCISVCAAYFLSINDATPIHSIHYGFLSLKRQQTFVSAIDDECAILYTYIRIHQLLFLAKVHEGKCILKASQTLWMWTYMTYRPCRYVECGCYIGTFSSICISFIWFSQIKADSICQQ